MNTKKYVISIVFVLTIMMPMVLALTHSLEEHEHQLCTAAAEHHIHAVKADCGSLHYLGPNLYPKPDFDYFFKIPGWQTSSDIFFYPVLTSEKSYGDADRGPPFLS